MAESDERSDGEPPERWWSPAAVARLARLSKICLLAALACAASFGLALIVPQEGNTFGPDLRCLILLMVGFVGTPIFVGLGLVLHLVAHVRRKTR
ncbi:hypothetical protein HY251_00570 [bacterium]|nr:hypothetical protein [bacterium]